MLDRAKRLDDPCLAEGGTDIWAFDMGRRFSLTSNRSSDKKAADSEVVICYETSSAGWRLLSAETTGPE